MPRTTDQRPGGRTNDVRPGAVRRFLMGFGRDHGFQAALLFMLPAALLYGYFLVYPMLDAIRLSFFQWSGFRTETPVFVGLDNYIRLFTRDPIFWTALTNSLQWVVLSLFIPTVISLLLALGLNARLAGRNLFRSVIYLPATFASITVAALWKWIYNPTVGAVNEILRSLGLERWTQQWLGDPDLAFYSVFVASIWQSVGMAMVLFLAGLQQVAPELEDAARVDGAGRIQRFRHVILPALRPTFVVVIILSIIGSLKVFDLIVGMTNGGPAQSSQVLALRAYTEMFNNNAFGRGGAVATILLIMSLCLVVPYLMWSLKERD